MEWMIWPRQYGKSYQLRKWWVEDPANRVILTENIHLARLCKDECKLLLAEKYPGNDDHINRLLVNNRIFSWRTWRNNHPTRDHMRCEVAIDGLEAILPALFKGKLAVATAAGVNEMPDPVIANRTDEFHREAREKYGIDWDS